MEELQPADIVMVIDREHEFFRKCGMVYTTDPLYVVGPMTGTIMEVERGQLAKTSGIKDTSLYI